MQPFNLLLSAVPAALFMSEIAAAFRNESFSHVYTLSVISSDFTPSNNTEEIIVCNKMSVLNFARCA